MARYRMEGSCPIEVDGKWILPGSGEFDADLPLEKLAFFTQIGAISVVESKPKPRPEPDEKRAKADVK